MLRENELTFCPDCARKSVYLREGAQAGEDMYICRQYSRDCDFYFYCTGNTEQDGFDELRWHYANCTTRNSELPTRYRGPVSPAELHVITRQKLAAGSYRVRCSCGWTEEHDGGIDVGQSAVKAHLQTAARPARDAAAIPDATKEPAVSPAERTFRAVFNKRTLRTGIHSATCPAAQPTSSQQVRRRIEVIFEVRAADAESAAKQIHAARSDGVTSNLPYPHIYECAEEPKKENSP